MGGGLVGRLERLRVGRYLPQGRGQAGRVTGHHRSRRVGQEFPAAGNGQPEQLGDKRPESGEEQPDDEKDGPDAGPVAADFPASSSPPQRPHDPVAQENDHPDHHHGQRLEADVIILDMGHFMGNDALELDPVELLKQPRRHAEDGMRRIASRGEGVGRRVVDDIAAGRGQAGGDGQPLDDVEQVRKLLLGDRTGMADGQGDLIPGVIARQGRSPRDEGG